MRRFPNKFWFGCLAGTGFGALVATIIVENGWMTQFGESRFIVKGAAWLFILGGVILAVVVGRKARPGAG